jgi:hypothetical protein
MLTGVIPTRHANGLLNLASLVPMPAGFTEDPIARIHHAKDQMTTIADAIRSHRASPIPPIYPTNYQQAVTSEIIRKIVEDFYKYF